MAAGFVAPSHVYYRIGCPGIGIAQELIDAGVQRVVFSAAHPSDDWPTVSAMLEQAGITIDARWEYPNN